MTMEQYDLWIVMDEELKANWLRALRSGKYKQGMGYLRSTTSEDEPDSFCCLGVLCDISNEGDWEYNEARGEIGRAHV